MLDDISVKFDKSVDAIAVANQQADIEDDQSQNISITTDTSPPKKAKQLVSALFDELSTELDIFREILRMILL